jgi:hypothetical protein
MEQVFWNDDDGLQEWQKAILDSVIKKNRHGHKTDESVSSDSAGETKENLPE